MEKPSETLHSEAIAEVGPDPHNLASGSAMISDQDRDPEKAVNRDRTSPSNSSDDVPENKTEEKVPAPERSKGKIALIMGALCVWNKIFIFALCYTLLTSP